MNLNLDFGFLNWGVISSFVAKGFIFSVQLTLVAMIGGIALGTLLAAMLGLALALPAARTHAGDAARARAPTRYPGPQTNLRWSLASPAPIACP